MRRALLASLTCLAGHAHAITLPAGNAETTVLDFAAQANLGVLYESGRLLPYYTHAVDSDDVNVALHQLLDGAGLTFSYLSPRVICVDPVEAPKPIPAQKSIANKSAQRAKASHPTLKLPTLIVTARKDICSCAQTYTGERWVDSQWCKYEDGRRQYVPQRCPLADPFEKSP